MANFLAREHNMIGDPAHEKMSVQSAVVSNHRRDPIPRMLVVGIPKSYRLPC